MWQSILLLLPVVQDGASAPVPESQGAAPEAQAAAPEDRAAFFSPLLHLNCQGAEDWLVDSKDQRLLAALQMLDDRLLELPEEVPEFDVPPGVLPLALRLLAGPSSLTVGLNSAAIPNMPMPFAAELRLTHSSSDVARALAGDVAGLIGSFGMPMSDPADGEAWVLPAPVPLWLTESDGSVSLRLGLEDGVDAPDQSALLPAGSRLSSSGLLDYGTLLGLIGQFAGGGDAQFEAMMGALDMFGLEDLSIEWATGTDADRSYTVMNMPGWAKVATEKGFLTTETLGVDIVSAIPGDATWASAFAFDLAPIHSMYSELFAAMSGEEDFDLDEMFSEATGLDLKQDLLGPFGKNAAVYASDTTGGGGMFSMVALVEIADQDAFHSSWAKLEEFTNQTGTQMANGYVRFSHVSQDGADLSVLSFPGLPIPVELCMAEAGGYAVLAVSPHALLGAVQHMNGSREHSLVSNPGFTEQLPRDATSGEVDMNGVLSIGWLNTPRLMQDGYAGVGLLCSALSNAVRSPIDVTREPGVILPSFHDLRAGAKPMVAIGRRVGPDFRSETRADRSLLVNASGVMGYMANSPVLPLMVAVAAGVVLPQAVARQEAATAEAMQRVAELELENEQEAQLFANIDAIYAALEAYAGNNAGKYPASLDELTVKDGNGNAYLDSSTLFDPWGDAYIYEAPKEAGDVPFVTYQE
jgi:hypothetical protein